jgi:hypothetical protein|tara:strand:- start:5599 stop:5919 length:321 start_codon:yes stop_codon:yes gene_type:complete
VTYRPLPNNITVGESLVDGIGLLAVEDIQPGHEFGITHIKDSRFENGYIRTPLGGFFNHSDSPNCEAYATVNGEYIQLRSLKQIKSGEELTAAYWLYNLDINTRTQ